MIKPIVSCPECGRVLEMKPKPGNPERIQGFCDCGKGRLRCVIEMDADAADIQPAQRAELWDLPAPTRKKRSQTWE